MGAHEKSKAVNGIIVNSTVKLEWKAPLWLESKSGIFYLACQEYESSNGNKISVLFVPDRAFIFADNGDISNPANIWSFSDVKSWAKTAFSGEVGEDFPESYDTYMPLAIIDGTVIDSTVNALGLSAHIDDIKTRLADISGFGAEVSVQL